MQLKEQILVLTNPDRLRIYKDNNMIYEGYVAMLEHNKSVTGDEQVTRLRATPELRHRKWKELGLMQPFKPEETPDYKYSDLQETLYYDIYIE